MDEEVRYISEYSSEVDRFYYGSDVQAYELRRSREGRMPFRLKCRYLSTSSAH